MSGEKISNEELRRHYDQCCAQSSLLNPSEEAFKGFIVGFRCYERMAQLHGVAVTESDSKRCVPRKTEA